MSETLGSLLYKKEVDDLIIELKKYIKECLLPAINSLNDKDEIIEFLKKEIE